MEKIYDSHVASAHVHHENRHEGGRHHENYTPIFRDLTPSFGAVPMEMRSMKPTTMG